MGIKSKKEASLLMFGSTINKGTVHYLAVVFFKHYRNT